jgi:hypothetical protein
MGVTRATSVNRETRKITTDSRISRESRQSRSRIPHPLRYAWNDSNTRSAFAAR